MGLYNRLLSFLAIPCLILVLFSCKKDNEVSSELSPEYFPMEEGNYFIYEVDSISLEAALQVNDTVQFQIKEVHDSLELDANGHAFMRIRRFKRYHVADNWVIQDVWTAERTGFNAQRVEENVRKICLGFPISEDASWDVNALNFMDSWEANYEDINVAAVVGDLFFSKAITVRRENVTNLIERKAGNKIYAEDVGMIVSYEKLLKFNDFIPVNEAPQPEQIELGHIIQYTLIEYGKE